MSAVSGWLLPVMPSAMSEADFVATFGEIYEESSWVARIAWWESERAELDDPARLREALRAVVDRSAPELKLALLRAHPDLAGRAALAGDLSSASASEQSSAGLDQCSAGEYREFQELNRAYRDRFRFPFIIAVGGLERAQILTLFRLRLTNSSDSEIATALSEVHKIAALRLRMLTASPAAGAS